jgi:uncharacterized repeat protein (TIGR01451 family)
MKNYIVGSLLVVTLLSAGGIPAYGGALAPSTSQANSTVLNSPIISPTPKWQYKGCFASWCQTGWYSSPAVADLNGDSKPEVIWSPYSIFVVDGATGSPVWSVRSGHDRSSNYDTTEDVGRTWPGIAVADIDGDGTAEVITAHSGGWVGVYDGSGAFKPGWPKQPFTNEIRSLAVDDLDGDGSMEIVVARASGGSYDQWTVLEPNGTTRPGWPRLQSGQPGYGWGAYNQNIGVADIDGDGKAEIVGPSDVHYISAFNDDGSQILTNARYNNTSNPKGTPKFWSQVGVHVDDAVDLRGYANCGAEHRPNFANSPPSIADIDGNGAPEILVVGNVYNCDIGNDASGDLAYLPFIFNADRSRWASGSFSWVAIPPLGGTSGKALSEDYNVIQSGLPNPVPSDLDGDGVKELLFASNDGKLHAYWMDKTEHGSWPFNVAALAGDMSFASEPVVADLDNDGHAEVIFGTWPRNGGRRVGKIIVADWQGRLLQQIALPAPRDTDADSWNGVLGAPTLANIDADADVELVVGTVSAGIVAYDLPGSANARVLWGTGRGSFLRTGAQSPPTTFTASAPAPVQPGDLVDFKLVLSDPIAAPLLALQLTDSLPSGLTYVPGSLQASSGTPNESGGNISWSGTLRSGKPITIAFQAQVSAAISSTTVLINQAQLSGARTATFRNTLIVKGQGVWLPTLRR